MNTLFGIFFLSATTVNAAPLISDVCPDTKAGETVQDCPWAGIARTLIREAEKGRPLSGPFKTLAPYLAKQLRQDHVNKVWQDLWGASINFDEFAKAEIVHPKVLSSLAEMFGTKYSAQNPFRTVHAGLEHTYGYLFSLLKTPFGYKRARWVSGDLDRGFGLPAGTLGPSPKKGSLFGNLTYFLGQIAFRGEPQALSMVEASAGFASPPLRGLLIDDKKIIRLEEKVDFGDHRTVILRTDFVPFPKMPGDPAANSHLLIYSVLDAAPQHPRLITAFPVQKSFVDKAIAPDVLGDQKISTRYNAFVDGLTGNPKAGKRTVVP